MAFTEFCCRSGGSNLNAGTRTGNSTEPGTSADFTYASGNWVQATRVFTVASGNPQSDGVAVGDFASVYADGSTVTGYVGRVTAVGTTTITISSSAIAGTAPTDGTGNRTLKIGGAWKGPNAAEAFPFAFIVNALTNSAGNRPRVNFKNDASYLITSGINHNVGGIYWFEGYGSAYGDGGRAVIDAQSNAIVPVTLTSAVGVFKGFEVKDNGASGTNVGITTAGAGIDIIGCVAHGIRGYGIAVVNSQTCAIECEVYDCNKAGTANQGGFNLVTSGAGSTAIRCISHDNAGADNHGFVLGPGATLIACIAESNGGSGAWENTANALGLIYNCDFYNNTDDGVEFAPASSTQMRFVENSNFIKNGRYGINVSNSNHVSGLARNNGFGAGTQVNTSGQTNIPAASLMVVSGSVTYANDVTPWVDPANGDFRINLTAAKGAGRGAFTETASSYAGTVGYPDIGSAQHLEVPGYPASRAFLGM